MAIQFVEAPGDAQQLATDGLHEVRSVARLKTAGGASLTTTEQVTLSSPHEVYTVGLDTLAARRPPAESPMVGWRFLVSTPTGMVASSEVTAGSGGQPTRSPS